MINTIELETNGISTFILNASEYLSFKNIDVTVVAPNIVNESIKNQLSQHHVNLVEVPYRRKNTLKYFFLLIRLISMEHYDVVHVNGNSTTMAIELLAAMMGGATLRISHIHSPSNKHPIATKILRPLFELTVNGRLACSSNAGNALYGKKQYKIIRNGINIHNFDFDPTVRKEFRKNLNIKNNEILLGHVGAFNIGKNQKYLIDLLSNLNSKYKLILLGSGIGDGSYLKKVKNYVREKKLDDRVIFAGSVNNVNDYLNAIDIFVFPSLFEGQPFSLIEALASGLPCYISDSISRKNDLTGNVIFLPLKNRKKWISEIKKAFKNFNRINRCKSNQRELISKGYDEKENIDVLINYYRKKLNRK